MYLSTKEHDQLRTIVMGFEIPFRTFIARRIISKYPSENDFVNSVASSTLVPGLSDMYYSEERKIKAKPEKYYKLMENAVKACSVKCVSTDTDVPYVATLITLYELYRNEVSDFLSNFPNNHEFASQMEKYKYVRNKLDHPQSKTLQTEDMYPVLSFVKEASISIFICDEECFWDKKQEEMEKEVLALETKVRVNPIACNNFSVIPFSDNSIVCRREEVEKIKTFVYGKPASLKKKTSLCIFGYGGVGKTAIVTETIKEIVRDVLDETTINGYKPTFILFFSAKETKLNYSHTSGSIVEEKVPSSFGSCEELEKVIFESLGIESFKQFNEDGIIIIDNLETLNQTERESIKEFVDSKSPQNVQYILTSRNEEPYDEIMSISGFTGDSGELFIDSYIEENELDVDLTVEQKKELLDASKGNTLVLVLSLQRLDKKVTSLLGITKDLNPSSLNKISKEISKIPLNGFEIISEFMFKNTFEELESLFEDKGKVLNSLLRVFAVYPSKSIDIYSICIITDFGYQDILPMMRLLCKYLILEKKEEKYSLNPFAEKYIIQKLLPDVTESQKMANDISRSLNEIKDNLKKLEKDLNDNPNIKNIISDWSIEYDGDKIVAAKMYAVYSDANKASQMGDPFHVNTSYDSFSKTVEKIESTTMHPYVKYQKARILQVFLQTKVDLGIKNENICVAFDECIWAIKTNGLYAKIMGTKTYASIMWIYGLFLSSILRNKEAIKYLEEAKRYFEEIECFDGEYYQCICKLASEYINEYEKEKIPEYIKRAKPIGDILYNNRDAYSGDKTTKYIATEINKKLKCYKI